MKERGRGKNKGLWGPEEVDDGATVVVTCQMLPGLFQAKEPYGVLHETFMEWHCKN